MAKKTQSATGQQVQAEQPKRQGPPTANEHTEPYGSSCVATTLMRQTVRLPSSLEG